MRRSLQLVLCASLVCFNATAVLGAVQTFNVDLFGVASSGHELRVFGTITLDPSLPVLAAIQSSSLQFQHQSDPLIAFTSLPNYYSGNPSSGLEWSVSDDNLYINRVSTADEFIVWEIYETPPFGPPFHAFGLGSGRWNHEMDDRNFSDHEDFAILKAAGPADGPTGFLVGTAIPEPSSAMILAGFGAAFCMRRRRQ